jgi:hypothetical protein
MVFGVSITTVNPRLVGGDDIFQKMFVLIRF